MRDDAEKETGGGDMLRRLQIRIERGAGQRLHIDVHAAARPQEIDHEQADREGEGRHHLEIDQRLDRHPSDLPGLPDGGDAVHHGAEDDQPDEHRDQPDEQIAQRAHPFRRLRPGPADQRAQRHAGENLERHVPVKRL